MHRIFFFLLETGEQDIEEPYNVQTAYRVGEERIRSLLLAKFGANSIENRASRSHVMMD